MRYKESRSSTSLGTIQQCNRNSQTSVQYNKTLTCFTLPYTVIQKSVNNFFELKMFLYIISLKGLWQKNHCEDYLGNFEQ